MHPKCTTIKNSLTTNLQSIPWKSFPRTFQDTIQFSRKLGVKFIWIDTLCIIQDDEQDWREQAAEMASIYSRAYLTLAATSSKDMNGGLFGTILPQYEGKGINFVIDDNIIKIYARQRLPHLEADLNATSKAQEMPLLERGWILQERLLSQRILHFTRNELLWECPTSSTCQCAVSDSRRSSIATLKQRFHTPKTTSDSNDWHRLVELYSRLNLSFPRDIFPALSGLAQQMIAKVPLSGGYVAGLWQRTLVEDLLWTVDPDYPVKRRPKEWRAPTWSWASVLSPVKFPAPETKKYPGDYDWQYLKYIRVTESHIDLAGKSSTGEISKAALHVIGKTCVANVQYSTRENVEFWLQHINTYQGQQQIDRWDRFSPDFRINDKSSPEFVENGSEVLCMDLARVEPSRHYTLVLRKVEGEKNTYKRIGMIRDVGIQLVNDHVEKAIVLV